MNKRTITVFTVITFVFLTATGQVDENQPNAKPGSRTSESGAFFKMGDFRIINNDWGAREMGCRDNSYEIFINEDKSFGWNFSRGACNDSGTKPDYPEVEFGMHPFSVGSDLATTPDYSSTEILPLRIKDINSASIKVEGMQMNLERAESYNLNFEMWFCEQHPATGNHTNAFAELIIFWAWQHGRWECVDHDRVRAGDGTYRLCHQSDDWGGWRYYQFRLEGGPNNNYDGKLDIKKMLDWLVNNRNFSRELWISRFEIGSEIGDNTKGSVRMRNITVEVNGVSKSPEFFEPVEVVDTRHPVKQHLLNKYIVAAHTRINVINLNGRHTRELVLKKPSTVAGVRDMLSPGVYMLSFSNGDPQTITSMMVPVIR